MATRSWEEMRTSIAQRLVRQTGHDVAWWNERIAAQGGIVDEPALRRWLTENGVTGYRQMLLVMETFGYPDYLLASADELVEGQYRDRPQLRPSSRRSSPWPGPWDRSTSRRARRTPRCSPHAAPSPR
jgi:hypothetical protein